MTQIDPFVEGKKVLLLGFGREGQSTYRMLERTKRYKELAIADQMVKHPWLPDPDIIWITGPDYQKTIDDYDVVFKSPGIVLEKPIEAYHCRIICQTEVFFRLFRDQIIGITGTKGKSTTTSLLYHILKSAGRRTLIAGNIGIPAFDQLDQVTEDTDIVFELSCHQLEYMTVSPHMGLLLNIHEEHLDHYGTMEKYVAAKQQIYRNQRPEDILFCSTQCLPEEGTCPSRLIAVEDLGEPKAADLSETGQAAADPAETRQAAAVLPKAGQEPADSADAIKPAGKKKPEDSLRIVGNSVFWKGSRYQIPTDEIRLMGHHNYCDIAFVYGVCKSRGISDEAFTQGLKTFEPLPHRLHFVGVRDGIRYYDDSISTICDTTIQALNTLKDADTVLIGGMDRGIDYRELIEYLSDSGVPHIILMEATGRRIYEEICRSYPDFCRPERLVLTEHLEDAVKQAKKLTRAGRSCVLSPAAASYGIFKNFEERGDVFEKLVLE